MMQYDSHANLKKKNKYDSSQLITRSANENLSLKTGPRNIIFEQRYPFKIEHLASVLFRHFGTISQVETFE